MNQDEIPAYLRRILGYVDKITETVQSMAMGTLREDQDEATKVNISDEAIEKLKKVKQ